MELGLLTDIELGLLTDIELGLLMKLDLTEISPPDGAGPPDRYRAGPSNEARPDGDKPS